MKIFYDCFEIIATLSESLIIFYAMHSLLVRRFSEKRQIAGYTISYIIVNFSMIFINRVTPKYSGILDIILILMYIVASMILFKGNRFFRAILPVVLLIIILIINISVNILTSAIFNVDAETLIQARDNIRLIGLFITKFMFFLIVRIGIGIVKRRELSLKSDEWIWTVVVFLISTIILISSAEIQYTQSDGGLHMMILVVGMILINIATFVFISKMTSKNHEKMMFNILKAQSQEQRKTFESIEQMYKNMMILKHDMKNEWIVVHQALKRGNYDLAEQISTDMLEDKIESFVDYIQVSSDTINAVLNYKLNDIKKKGIDISCKIEDDFDCFYDNDLAMLISNLLDNASEASVKQENPCIHVDVSSKKNYLNIVIANKIDESVLQHNANLKTTKKDTQYHGLGTKSIFIIAEKYGGMTDFYEKNGFFVAHVMLNKSHPKSKKLPNTN